MRSVAEVGMPVAGVPEALSDAQSGREAKYESPSHASGGRCQ